MTFIYNSLFLLLNTHFPGIITFLVVPYCHYMYHDTTYKAHTLENTLSSVIYNVKDELLMFYSMRMMLL